MKPTRSAKDTQHKHKQKQQGNQQAHCLSKRGRPQADANGTGATEQANMQATICRKLANHSINLDPTWACRQNLHMLASVRNIELVTKHVSCAGMASLVSKQHHACRRVTYQIYFSHMYGLLGDACWAISGAGGPPSESRQSEAN